MTRTQWIIRALSNVRFGPCQGTFFALARLSISLARYDPFRTSILKPDGDQAFCGERPELVCSRGARMPHRSQDYLPPCATACALAPLTAFRNSLAAGGTWTEPPRTERDVMPGP